MWIRRRHDSQRALKDTCRINVIYSCFLNIVLQRHVKGDLALLSLSEIISLIVTFSKDSHLSTPPSWHYGFICSIFISLFEMWVNKVTFYCENQKCFSWALKVNLFMSVREKNTSWTAWASRWKSRNIHRDNKKVIPRQVEIMYTIGKKNIT